MTKDHGNQIKNDKQYEELRMKGMSKERAARISNSQGSSKRGGRASNKSSQTAMSKSLESKAAENEAIFRDSNQKIAKGFSELKGMAQEEGHLDWVLDMDQPVDFYCECSDENCRKRITQKPSDYLNIRKNSSQFILLPGHNIPEIERVVESADNYIVVEKYKTPPRNYGKLNRTERG